MTEKLRPIKSLGQNFLTDKNIINKIVQSIDIIENDNIFEIGPGMGALTEYILEHKVNYSGIELDERAKEYLENKFSDINIINADFLKYNIPDEIHNYKVVGNLPYYITSSILFKIYEWEKKPSKCIFMVQKEVSDRINGKVGSKENGILSILTNFVGSSKKLFDVSPRCFYPRPRVTSSIIEIKFHNKYNLDFKPFATLVKAAFNQRRKQLGNSLKSYGALPANYKSKRAEQLNCDEFVELYQILNDKETSI
ncbi:16S rRNA (adenine(1518)-N(6)/adenine(1519)-N(6))-dimethyltransferase RsmA [Candidatus Kapabacteria bacterium]|nr:16S rRNA (adenine(1518)-N(6)/adenine(1519)-N(6))-dimethyltransferase RsmA [Candidatus Kapabacteria bacterium]